MLHGVTPSLPSTTSGGSSAAPAAAPPTYADIEEELASRSRNLSSTLHKLHLWEKKLYHEVKVRFVLFDASFKYPVSLSD